MVTAVCGTLRMVRGRTTPAFACLASACLNLLR